MKLLSATTPKTFSLLSIGQRGVGKTVFLAGSYTELHPDHPSHTPEKLWFDCQDEDVQTNLENIKNHVARTGLYPPPTIKITNFNFSLQRRTRWGVKTVCHFRWWDIPGESCNIYNPEFQEMILTSSGCCVFINANALLQDEDYPRILEDIYNQVAAIASIVYKYNLKYAFALVLTKCDLIELNPANESKIDKSLQPLTTYLDSVKVTHQKFYSAIPIVSVNGISTLKATGAASPILWLLSQVNNSGNFSSPQNLMSGLRRRLRPTSVRSILMIYLVSVILVGAIASLFFAFHIFTSTKPLPNPVPQNNPTN